MLKLYDGMSLYHGSYCEVRMPDLAKCAKGKDFGRRFYLTSSKEQDVNLHFAVLTGCLRISKESIFGTPSECVGN